MHHCYRDWLAVDLDPLHVIHSADVYANLIAAACNAEAQTHERPLPFVPATWMMDIGLLDASLPQREHTVQVNSALASSEECLS